MNYMTYGTKCAELKQEILDARALDLSPGEQSDIKYNIAEKIHDLLLEYGFWNKFERATAKDIFSYLQMADLTSALKTAYVGRLLRNGSLEKDGTITQKTTRRNKTKVSLYKLKK